MVITNHYLTVVCDRVIDNLNQILQRIQSPSPSTRKMIQRHSTEPDTTEHTHTHTHTHTCLRRLHCVLGGFVNLKARECIPSASSLPYKASYSTFSYAEAHLCQTFFITKQVKHHFLIPQFGISSDPHLQK